MESIAKKDKQKDSYFSPRLALVAASALTVVGLVGVGNLSVVSPEEQVPLLTLSAESVQKGQQASGTTEDASSALESDMMRYQPYNYIYITGETLSNESGESDGYRLALPSEPEVFFSKVARYFGLEEFKTVKDPYGYDSNYYVIGDYTSYNGKVLGYSHAGAGYWSYSNSAAYAETDQYPEECYSRTTSIDEEGNVMESIDESLSEICNNWTPAPTVGLPSEQAAEDYAKKLFSDIYGFDFELTVYSNEYAVSVSGSRKVDGNETGLNVGVSWNGSEVSYAYGFSASPELIKDLAIVSPLKATKRIGDYRWWGYDMGGIIAYPMLSADSRVAVEVAAGIPEADDVSEVPGDTRTSDASREEDKAEMAPEPGMPYPGDDFVIEDKEITLVGATLKLLTVYASDGSMWLLPGYVYETSEELLYTQPPSIIAVEDSLIQLG